MEVNERTVVLVDAWVCALFCVSSFLVACAEEPESDTRSVVGAPEEGPENEPAKRDTAKRDTAEPDPAEPDPAELEEEQAEGPLDAPMTSAAEPLTPTTSIRTPEVASPPPTDAPSDGLDAGVEPPAEDENMGAGGAESPAPGPTVIAPPSDPSPVEPAPTPVPAEPSDDPTLCEAVGPVPERSPTGPSFAATVAEILATRCTESCHEPGGILGGPGGFHEVQMSFTLEDSYCTLTTRRSTEVPTMWLVGTSLEESYLWHKLNGTFEEVGGTGAQMPITGVVTPDELEAIGAWIEGGAAP